MPRISDTLLEHMYFTLNKELFYASFNVSSEIWSGDKLDKKQE